MGAIGPKGLSRRVSPYVPLLWRDSSKATINDTNLTRHSKNDSIHGKGIELKTKLHSRIKSTLHNFQIIQNNMSSTQSVQILQHTQQFLYFQFIYSFNAIYTHLYSYQLRLNHSTQYYTTHYGISTQQKSKLQHYFRLNNIMASYLTTNKCGWYTNMCWRA